MVYRRIYQRGIEYIPGLYSCDASKLSRRSDASRAKNHDNHENF
jgi:hypothetical protein